LSVFPTVILSNSIFVLNTGSGQNIPRTSSTLASPNSEILIHLNLKPTQQY
jgi:hypothetical protein